MATMRWTTSRTFVHNPGYHIIFCLNYRRLMLGPSVGHKCWGGEIRERVIVLLNEKAVELAVKIFWLIILALEKYSYGHQGNFPP